MISDNKWVYLFNGNIAPCTLYEINKVLYEYSIDKNNACEAILSEYYQFYLMFVWYGIYENFNVNSSIGKMLKIHE